MIPKESRILQRLAKGKTCSCFKVNLSDPRIVEIAGLSGVDSIWLCNEHVANDWLNLENQVRAARLYGMDALVRVAKGSYSEYIKPLELGATGLIIPNVTSAREAREIVDMTRFHPLGHRAMDGGNCDGDFAFLPPKEYIEHSNRNQILILQIESPEGLEQVDEIAAVEGYQFLFFGPGDYSHKIGLPGEIHHPRVQEAREQVAAAAARHGKWLFHTGITLEQCPTNVPQVFIIGSDVTALGEVCRQRQNSFSEGAKLPATPV